MSVEQTQPIQRQRASAWGELVLEARDPAVVARIDREGWPVVYANRAFARRLGVRLASLLGRSLWSIDRADDEAAGCVRGAVAAGEQVSCVLRIDRHDAEPRWFEATFQPLHADGGAVTHVLVTHLELTREPIAA